MFQLIGDSAEPEDKSVSLTGVNGLAVKLPFEAIQEDTHKGGGRL